MQLAAVRSYANLLIEPLEHDGASVFVYLALHGECNSSVNRVLQGVPGIAERLAAATPIFAYDLDNRTAGWASNQGTAMRNALDFFLAETRRKPVDVLIVTRYDLTLRAPVSTWSCDVGGTVDRGVSSRFGFSAQCQAAEWNGFNCTYDILYVVPQRHIDAFSRAVGVGKTHQNAGINGCCFHQSCLKSGGHSCYNALVHTGIPVDEMTFCWPPAKSKFEMLFPNNHFYELSQCADGMTSGRPKGCGKSVNKSALVAEREAAAEAAKRLVLELRAGTNSESGATGD
jgi:hypothetical protein